jgi:hypothetical protein
MVVPEPGEPLLLYIAATSEAVSMVLVVERPNPHTCMSSGARLLTGQGPRTRGLRRSRELSQQPGPSPQRPPWALMTRQSRGPGLQSSH